jgi:hypothetical protein
MSVTEEEWLTCLDPDRMLELLGGKISQRKMQLFGAACCRLIWDILVEDTAREAVQVAERHADGLASDDELARAALDAGDYQLWFSNAAAATLLLASGRPIEASRAAALTCSMPDGFLARRRLYALLLHDLAGNPFRPVAPDDLLQARGDAAVVALARELYEERSLPGGELDASRLAILGDALEDAGCTNAAILNHCRGTRQHAAHVRGCWALDLVLGKE